VEEDHPDRGVPNATVNVWRIARVFPGRGMPPSDYLSDGRATTDADGLATIERVRRSAAYLQVTASGFTLGRRTIPAADEAETVVEIALARGTVIAGRVWKADGTAAEGVRVGATQPEQRGWVVDSHEAVTDRRGAFRLSGIFPGWVSLHATLHEGDAVWVADATAEAGGLNAEVRMPAEPVRRKIRVLVRGADGLPVSWARWHAEDGLYTPYYRASSHGIVENGEFLLPPDPDVQWVTISHPRDKDQGDLPWAPAVVGPLGSRGGDLVVAMPRGSTVSGAVRDERGNPLRRVSVFARPLIPEGETLRSASDKAWSMAWTDRKGRFLIEGVPPGRVEVDPFTGDGEWSVEPMRGSAPADGLDFVVLRQPRLRGSVRHPDGTPAPEAELYVQGADAEAKPWSGVRVDRTGNFSVYHDAPGGIRLRAGLSPSGPEDMVASEVVADPGVDDEAVVLTVPQSRSILVRIPDWPASAVGAARIASGPWSRGHSSWILGDVARFEGIDPAARLSFYGGPLSDGRIAFSRELPTADEVSVPLVASRTIVGRARGFPFGAEPDGAWADTSEFEAPGRVDPTGSFSIRGVPRGACRVRVVFRRGTDVWAGSVWDTGAAVPIEIEVRRMDEAAYAAWVFPRPSP
jgi:hypothetical protein